MHDSSCTIRGGADDKGVYEGCRPGPSGFGHLRAGAGSQQRQKPLLGLKSRQPAATAGGGLLVSLAEPSAGYELKINRALPRSGTKDSALSVAAGFV